MADARAQALAAERVTSTAQARGVDPAYQAHEQEALLLVELLRSSRLSLLYAEAGSDKTALLRFGLIPLLCRRAGDRLVPAAARASGVVVPFSDRRSRASKRQREIVVYFGDWTDTPLAALRETLYRAVATEPTDRLKANARLSRILEDLSQRFDAHLIVLLDRFENLLQAPSDEAVIGQFADELAEAINHPQLPANFLIALAEEAKPRLASLRSRISGFDDSSLKLAPPRDFKRTVAPTWRQEPAVPAAVEALPALTDALTVPDGDPMAPPVAQGSMVRAPGKRKVKRPPLPRVEIRIADVYAMIDAALARFAVQIAVGPSDRTAIMAQSRTHDRRPTAFWPPNEPAADCAPAQTGPAQPLIPARNTSARGVALERAIERMERRLGMRPKDGPDSQT